MTTSTIKNPRRVAAGKLNRAKRPPLSDEARTLLREAALVNRPWLASTGPRTAEGKAKSSANAKRCRLPNGVLTRSGVAFVIARNLKRQLVALKKNLLLDADTMEIKSTDALAEQLQQILSGTDVRYAQAAASQLMQKAASLKSGLIGRCRQSAARRLNVTEDLVDQALKEFEESDEWEVTYESE